MHGRTSGGIPMAPLAGFAALALALVLTGWLIEHRVRAQLRAQAIAQLAAIADLKADQIAAWRTERLADATGIAVPPVPPAELAWVARGEPPPARIAGWYRSVQARHVYDDIVVVAAGGAPIFSTSPAARLDPVTAETAARALREGRAVLSDLHRSPANGRVYVDAAAPMSGLAAVVLRTDAENFLFPRLQAWPTRSATGETLLVRRDGDSVLFLNELRHTQGAALTLRAPLTRTDLPAVAAVLGATGSVDGVDYRGARVLAELRAVPGSPWTLVAKIDRDEIFATERHLAWAATAAGAAFALLGGLVTVLLWRHAAAARAAADRIATEEALRSRAEVLANVSEAVIATDAQFRVTAWNPGAERVYGWSEAEVLGRPLPALVATEYAPPRDRPWAIAELERTGRVELDVKQRRRDGTRVEIEATVVARRGADGRLTGFIGVNRDLTERRRAEADLRRANERLALADRMASLGALAAGVAHEINNPLTYVLSSVEAAEERARALDGGAGGELRGLLAEVREGAERVRGIVDDLKALSRSDDEARGPVDVRRILDQAVNLARHELRHRARVVRDYGGVPPVDANESRLAQALLNLVVNAAQAIPEGDQQAHEVRLRTRLEGGRVRVDVCDTGAGVPADLEARIFDPFFTTKPVGEGTGLGLSITHGIVASLGGEIRVSSGPEGGATFTVLLPAAAAPARAPAVTAARRTPPPGPRGRVLVVDDEPGVASSLRRLLAREHEVVTAPGGKAALDLVAGGARFDVILCDLMMPEVTGMDLHERLAAIAPDAAGAMVFMTGGAFTPRARRFLEDPARLRFSKPFDPEAIRALVREAVARSASARAAAP